MGFREDINGLRAVAVTVVLLFHFGVPGFSGGFVGVDIFFVISGYLMTQILVSRLDRVRGDGASTWSVIRDFYLARARRIIPVLAALCAAILAVGYLILDPLAYQKAAGNTLASLLFYSNVHYYFASGYFEAASTSNILLHTWSLSVEWQFYLLYPIVIWAITRQRRIGLAVCLTGLALLSLAASVVLTWVQPPFGFYMLPARGWEMLAGGIVFAVQDRPIGLRLRLMLAGGGTLLIVGSVAVFDKWTPWPSGWAAAPVLGTALVLAARFDRGRWCANAPVHALGRASYSIYLWHWPAVFLLAYYDVAPTPLVAAGAVAAVLVVSAASYQLIEQRFSPPLFRRGRPWTPAANAALAAILLASFGGIAGVLASHGAASRHGDEARFYAMLRAAQADWSHPSRCSGLPSPLHKAELRPCALGPDNGPATLVVGDSFAQQLYARFAGDPAPAKRITFITSGGCPPVPGFEQRAPGARCALFNRKLDDAVAKGSFDRVVVTAMWPAYFAPPARFADYPLCERSASSCRTPADAGDLAALRSRAMSALEARIRTWRAAGKPVMIVLTTPYQLDDPAGTIARRRFRGQGAAGFERIDRAAFAALTRDIDAGLRAVAAHTGATVFDPLPALCGPKTCPIIDAHGRLLYKDASHLRGDAIRAASFTALDRFMLARG